MARPSPARPVPLRWPGRRGADTLSCVPVPSRPWSARRSCLGALVAVAVTTTSGLGRAAEPEPAPPPVAPEPTPAVAVAPPAHQAHVDEGHRLVAAGQPGEGAGQLAEAYALMPVEVRVGAEGRVAVILACNAYEAAWQASADAGHLEANRVLLSAYLADLDGAREAGRATAPADDDEAALRERARSIDAMLAKVRPPAPVPVSAPTIDPASVEPQLELTFPPPDPRLRRNALLLVGAGAAGTVAGGIMVLAGALKASRAEEARSGMLVEDAAEARSAKTSGTVLATAGAILFSGSVMMLGVGSNRLGELRRELALGVGPSLGGVVVRGRF